MTRNLVRVAVVGVATVILSLGGISAATAQSNDDSYGTTTATTAGVQPTDDTRGRTATTAAAPADDGADDVAAAPAGDDSLARTGVAVAGLLAVALALLVIGRASIEASRRRRRAVTRQQAAAHDADRAREAVTG